MNTPDFLIVGAGSCGSVIARTLFERGFRVVLIEAGGNLAINRRPADYVKLFGGEQDWALETLSQKELAGRRLSFPRGKGPGGSTRINAMIWYPPPETDWLALAQAGGDFWDTQEITKAFQTIEAWVSPETPTWISVSTQQVLEVCESLGKSMQAYRRMTRRGKRYTSFDLLGQALQHADRFQVMRATVNRVCLEEDRAVAVEVEGPSGNPEFLKTKRGVILCGGAIHSPHLLFASGIACQAELANCELNCRVDLPAVGKHLADHLIMPVIYHRSTDRFPISSSVADLARWDYLGTGPLTSNLAEAGGVFDAGNGVACQLHITPTHYLLHPHDRSPAALSLGVNVCRPQARGRLHWHLDQSTNRLQPSIDPHYCETQHDRESLLSAVNWARQLGGELQSRCVAGDELIPGQRRNSSDADWKAITRFAQTLYHPCGTCRLGCDWESVVDPQLRVRGVRDLYVVDASVLPTIPSINPNALLMAMAHHAALAIP